MTTNEETSQYGRNKRELLFDCDHKHGLYFQADGDWVFAVAKLCEHLTNSVLLTSPYIHNLKQSNDTDGEIQ